MQAIVPILTHDSREMTTSLANPPGMSAHCRRSLAGLEVSTSQMVKQITQQLSYARLLLASVERIF